MSVDLYIIGLALSFIILLPLEIERKIEKIYAATLLNEISGEKMKVGVSFVAAFEPNEK